MHSLLVVDANGYRLTNSIIWADNRSIIQNRAAERDGTGMPFTCEREPIHPMSPLTKLMWMRDYDLIRSASLPNSVNQRIYLLTNCLGATSLIISIASQAYST